MASRFTRTDWYFRRSAFPLRDAMPFELESSWANQHKHPHAANVHWEQVGPLNFAGRVTSLARDTGRPGTILAGSAAGGLWVSRNDGRNWRSCWPKFISQNIGAVACAKGQWICATGEGNLDSDLYPGTGVYTSRDRGRTWEPYVSAESTVRIPRRVASLAVNPATWQIAFGAVSKDETLLAGLYLERNAFVTRWGTRSYNCHSVVFHPTDPSVIYAAVEPNGTWNGVWRSADRGVNWQHLHTRGLPKPERCGRIALAIAASRPSILYALVAGLDGKLLGVFRTADGGETWNRTALEMEAGDADTVHNAVIAVHPDEPGFVLAGTRRLYRSRTGGRSWTRLLNDNLPDGHHALLLSGPASKPVIFSGNDQGVSFSPDGGRTWERRSNGMDTAMFYDLDLFDRHTIAGAAQNLGVLTAGKGSHGRFRRIFGGQDGFVAFDPANPGRLYAALDGGQIHRHDPSRGPAIVRIPLSQGEKKLRSRPLFAIRPAKSGWPQQQWLATSRLWLASDSDAKFRPVTSDFDFSAVSAIAFSDSDPCVVLAGTSEGGIFRLRWDGKRWAQSGNLSSTIIPNRLITQIKFLPGSPNIAVLTVGSTNAPAVNLYGTAEPYLHVFVTFDQGDTWHPFEDGKLPNVVYNALALESTRAARRFIGGDLGVWAMDEYGLVNITGNLPNVIVSDLAYDAASSTLTAATFGRGIWRLELPREHWFRRAPRRSVREPMAPPFAGHVPDHTVPPPAGFAYRQGRLTWKPVPKAFGYSIWMDNAGQQSIYTSAGPSIKVGSFPRKHLSFLVWALLPNGKRTLASASYRPN